LFLLGIQRKHLRRGGKGWMRLPSLINMVFTRLFEEAKNAKYANEYLATFR
jgi:hypothetical protein